MTKELILETVACTLAGSGLIGCVMVVIAAIWVIWYYRKNHVRRNGILKGVGVCLIVEMIFAIGGLWYLIQHPKTSMGIIGENEYRNEMRVPEERSRFSETENGSCKDGICSLKK